PNGKYLLVSSKDTFKFLILDISTGKVINKQDGLLHKITPALSPDGRYITTSTDSTVRIWDAFSGKSVHSLNHHNNLNSVVYSPDGNQLLTVTSKGECRLWDSETGKVVYSLESNEHKIQRAYFSRDGKNVITDHQMDMYLNYYKIWSTSSGQL